MRIFFVFIFIAGIGRTCLTAQTTHKEQDFSRWTIRTGISSYFDYDAGVMMGINYRWTQYFSATLEYTRIFYNGFVTNTNFPLDPSGYKIRADLRYHFPRQRSGKKDFFVAPVFHYKYTETDREENFGINCQNGQCAYFQQATYKDIKKEIGGFINFGMDTPFPFIGNENLQLELYAGFGMKHLKFKETNLPVGASFLSPPDRTIFNFGSSTTRNEGSTVMFPFGVKLLFKL